MYSLAMPHSSLHQDQQLHHRSSNQKKTTEPSTKASPQSQTNPIKLKRETLSDSCPSSNRKKYSFKKFFSLLSICTLLLSLSIYSLALICFDWPPDGGSNFSDTNTSLDFFHKGDWWLSPNLTRALRYMLVVAHPDDEALFFSPTLINLASPRLVISTESESTHPLIEHPSGHILCLSSGNADGLGFKRTREMKASCRGFGIPSSNCIIIDDRELSDSMSVWWTEEKIAEYVKSYLDIWEIDVIITFDDQGVSSHANHRAISAALQSLAQTEPTFPMTFMLQSRSLIEKYSWLVSLPVSLYRHHRHLNLMTTDNSSTTCKKGNQIRRISKSKFTSSERSLILSSPRQYLKARQIFAQHVSQNVWFRRLWLLFSRYMWINELVRVV